jgi:hypothetical protein
MHQLLRALVLVVLICLIVPNAIAQRLDGSLTGAVTDPTGAVVPNATVKVENEATGVSHQTTTTSAGTYTFPNLIVGNYTVQVVARGFAPYTRKGVAVSSNQMTEAHAKLLLGTETTTVEVQAGASVIETTSSQLSNAFSEQQVIDMPTASASPLNLAILAPNVTTQGGGVLGSGGSVGGTRPRMNNFAIDGVDDNDQSITGNVSTVINDAVAEFSVITNQFSAEYGHSAGGQFNLITKSGTNNWHGSTFWYLRNRNLNALDNLQKQSYVECPSTSGDCGKPKYDDNTQGGTIGGPVIKNKLFVFGAFQHHKLVQAATGVTVQVPTAAGLSLLNGLAVNQSVKDVLAQFPTAGANDAGNETVHDPVTGAAVLIPLGNTNFVAPSYSEDYNWQANGDLSLDKHQLHVRFLYNRNRQPNLPAPALPQFSGATAYDVRKLMLNEVWSINPHLINDLRFGFTHQMGLYGVPGVFSNFPNVTVDSLSNFVIGPEANSPQNGGQNLYQLVDQMTWSVGKHTWKWGVESRRYISPSNFLPRSRGDWYYADLDNLITDTVPIDFAKRGAGNGGFPGNSWAFYGFVQDDFKVSSRLTLNLGLRYEWNGMPFGASYQALNSISNLSGVYDFRVPKSDTNNFAPRIGFAWDPTGSSKWAIRGGFGMAYDVNFTNLQLLQLPPQLQSEQDPFITCALPGAPAWCANFNGTVYNAGGRTGAGFLNQGGLLQTNVPPATQADARAATQGIIVDNTSPKIFTWSAGVQRELWKNTSVEVRYIGTNSQLLPVQYQTNARSAFENGALPLTTWFSQSTVPATLPTNTPTLDQFSALSVRPYAADGFVGSVSAFPGLGQSNYHGGSVDFVHRMQRGLYLRANYTFAKNWDNSTNELFSSLVNPRRPEDGNHIRNDWGRSTLDIRQKFTISWAYELPKWNVENGFLKKVVEGWQLNGAYLLQTGQPVTALSNADSNGNGDTAGDRAILNPNASGNGGSDIGNVYMNPTTGATCTASCGAAFTQIVGYYAVDSSAKYVRAGVGTVTNVGRNTLESPGLNNIDFSVFKNTYLTEDKYIQFRAEFYNFLNHRQFSFANTGVFGLNNAATDNASYSRVYTSGFMDPKFLNGGARAIQLSLKFIF